MIRPLLSYTSSDFHLSSKKVTEEQSKQIKRPKTRGVVNGTARNDITIEFLKKVDDKKHAKSEARKRKFSSPDVVKQIQQEASDATLSEVFEREDFKWIKRMKVPDVLKNTDFLQKLDSKMIKYEIKLMDTELRLCFPSITDTSRKPKIIFKKFDNVILSDFVQIDPTFTSVKNTLYGQINEIYWKPELVLPESNLLDSVIVKVQLYLTSDQIKTHFNCQPKSSTPESHNHFTEQNFKNKSALYATTKTALVSITSLENKVNVLSFNQWSLNKKIKKNGFSDFYSAGIFKIEHKSVKTIGKTNEKLEVIQAETPKMMRPETLKIFVPENQRDYDSDDTIETETDFEVQKITKVSKNLIESESQNLARGNTQISKETTLNSSHREGR